LYAFFWDIFWHLRTGGEENQEKSRVSIAGLRVDIRTENLLNGKGVLRIQPTNFFVNENNRARNDNILKCNWMLSEAELTLMQRNLVLQNKNVIIINIIIVYTTCAHQHRSCQFTSSAPHQSACLCITFIELSDSS
jgi:hypothetical protein